MADDPDTNAPASPRRQGKCPICGRPTQAATRPFCSPRCAEVDLARWLGGRYVIAGHADAEEDETVSADSISRRISQEQADNDDTPPRF